MATNDSIDSLRVGLGVDFTNLQNDLRNAKRQIDAALPAARNIKAIVEVVPDHKSLNNAADQIYKQIENNLGVRAQRGKALEIKPHIGVDRLQLNNFRQDVQRQIRRDWRNEQQKVRIPITIDKSSLSGLKTDIQRSIGHVTVLVRGRWDGYEPGSGPPTDAGPSRPRPTGPAGPAGTTPTDPPEASGKQGPASRTGPQAPTGGPTVARGQRSRPRPTHAGVADPAEGVEVRSSDAYDQATPRRQRAPRSGRAPTEAPPATPPPAGPGTPERAQQDRERHKRAQREWQDIEAADRQAAIDRWRSRQATAPAGGPAQQTRTRQSRAETYECDQCGNQVRVQDRARHEANEDPRAGVVGPGVVGSPERPAAAPGPRQRRRERKAAQREQRVIQRGAGRTETFSGTPTHGPIEVRDREGNLVRTETAQAASRITPNNVSGFGRNNEPLTEQEEMDFARQESARRYSPRPGQGPSLPRNMDARDRRVVAEYGPEGRPLTARERQDIERARSAVEAREQTGRRTELDEWRQSEAFQGIARLRRRPGQQVGDVDISQFSPRLSSAIDLITDPEAKVDKEALLDTLGELRAAYEEQYKPTSERFAGQGKAGAKGLKKARKSRQAEKDYSPERVSDEQLILGAAIDAAYAFIESQSDINARVGRRAAPGVAGTRRRQGRIAGQNVEDVRRMPWETENARRGRGDSVEDLERAALARGHESVTDMATEALPAIGGSPTMRGANAIPRPQQAAPEEIARIVGAPDRFWDDPTPRPVEAYQREGIVQGRRRRPPAQLPRIEFERKVGDRMVPVGPRGPAVPSTYAGLLADRYARLRRASGMPTINTTREAEQFLGTRRLPYRLGGFAEGGVLRFDEGGVDKGKLVGIRGINPYSRKIGEGFGATEGHSNVARANLYDWKKTRSAQIRRQPWCSHCGISLSEARASGIPMTADHKVSQAQGGTDDPENLQTLCRNCNSRKSGSSMNIASWEHPRPRGLTDHPKLGKVSPLDFLEGGRFHGVRTLRQALKQRAEGGTWLQRLLNRGTYRPGRRAADAYSRRSHGFHRAGLSDQWSSPGGRAQEMLDKAQESESREVGRVADRHEAGFEPLRTDWGGLLAQLQPREQGFQTRAKDRRELVGALRRGRYDYRRRLDTLHVRDQDLKESITEGAYPDDGSFKAMRLNASLDAEPRGQLHLAHLSPRSFSKNAEGGVLGRAEGGILKATGLLQRMAQAGHQPSIALVGQRGEQVAVTDKTTGQTSILPPHATQSVLSSPPPGVQITRLGERGPEAVVTDPNTGQSEVVPAHKTPAWLARAREGQGLAKDLTGRQEGGTLPWRMRDTLGRPARASTTRLAGGIVGGGDIQRVFVVNWPTALSGFGQARGRAQQQQQGPQVAAAPPGGPAPGQPPPGAGQQQARAPFAHCRVCGAGPFPNRYRLDQHRWQAHSGAQQPGAQPGPAGTPPGGAGGGAGAPPPPGGRAPGSAAGGAPAPGSSRTGTDPYTRVRARDFSRTDIGGFAERITNVRAGISENIQAVPSRALSVAIGQIFQNAVGGRAEILSRARGASAMANRAARAEAELESLRQQRFEVRSAMRDIRAGRLQATPERFAELEDLNTNLRQATMRQRGVVRQRTDAAEDRERNILTRGQQFRSQAVGLGGIIAGTQLFTAAISAATVATEAASRAISPLVDQTLGWAAAMDRTSGTMRDAIQQARRAGGREEAIAGMAISAGMGPRADRLLSALADRAEAQAASRIQLQAQDATRAAVGAASRSNEALFAGTGGLFGGSMFAEQMGGQPGFLEGVVGQLRAATPARNSNGARAPFDVSFQQGLRNSPPGAVIAGLQDISRTVEDLQNPERVEPTDEEYARQRRLVIEDLNDAFGRAALAVGEATAAYEIHEGANKELTDAMLESARRIGGAAAERAKELAEMGVAVTGRGGRALRGREFEPAAMELARGRVIMDPTQFMRTTETQRRAQISLMLEQGRVQREQDIPAAAALESIINPAPRFGATFQAGGQGLETTEGGRDTLANIERYSGMVADANQSIATTVKTGMAALEDIVSQIDMPRIPTPGDAAPSGGHPTRGRGRAATAEQRRPALTEFRGIISQIGSIGEEIREINEGIQMRQVNLSVREYSNQIRVSSRTLADSQNMWAAIQGNVTDTYGGLQGQNMLLERQNQLLQQRQARLGFKSEDIGFRQADLQQQAQQLQFQQSQRQINFQRALAGFVVPGLTPEEQAARVEAAEIEADFAQKQLDIQVEIAKFAREQLTIAKEQAGINRAAFGNQVQMQDNSWQINVEDARRNITDLMAQLDLLREGRAVTIDTAAAEAAVGRLQKQQGQLVAQAQQYIQQGQEIRNAVMSDNAAAIAATGQGWYQLQSQVQSAWQGFFQGYLDPMASRLQTWGIPTSSGTSGSGSYGGGAGGRPPMAQATGGIHNVSTATPFIAGEAGNETVVVLRNPKTGMTSIPVGGGGGGSTINFNISITGGSDVDEGQLRTWAMRITRDVERNLNERAQTLGLRPI